MSWNTRFFGLYQNVIWELLHGMKNFWDLNSHVFSNNRRIFYEIEILRNDFTCIFSLPKIISRDFLLKICKMYEFWINDLSPENNNIFYLKKIKIKKTVQIVHSLLVTVPENLVASTSPKQILNKQTNFNRKLVKTPHDDCFFVITFEFGNKVIQFDHKLRLL